MWKLGRTKQCKKCPWKCATNPEEIPNGYQVELHKDLKGTISKEGLAGYIDPPKVAMACHESKIGKEVHCVGWVNQQMGVGNNIRLRMQLMNCDNINELEVYGDQHRTFEETLPKIVK